MASKYLVKTEVVPILDPNDVQYVLQTEYCDHQHDYILTVTVFENGWACARLLTQVLPFDNEGELNTEAGIEMADALCEHTAQQLFESGNDVSYKLWFDNGSGEIKCH